MEYQKSLELGVKNITKINGDQYMKLFVPYFLRIKFIPKPFLYLCKNNPNQPQFKPYDTKILLKQKAMEQGLCAKMVMIRRKDLDNKIGR